MSFDKVYRAVEELGRIRRNVDVSPVYRFDSGLQNYLKSIHDGANLNFWGDDMDAVEFDLGYIPTHRVSRLPESIEMRNRLSHMCLNYNFGELAIYPDGKVYSDNAVELLPEGFERILADLGFTVTHGEKPGSENRDDDLTIGSG